jgi:1-acyl-sn-glycerol-3-phosphate acyltransferase
LQIRDAPPPSVSYHRAVVKRHAIKGLYTYLEFGVVLTTFIPVMAASSLRHRTDPTQRIPGRWLRRLGRTASRLTPLWKFDIEGEAPADIGTRPYVVVANHESQADPFLLSFLPWDMRWVAKEELFKTPLTGWAMRLGGDIPIRRGEGASVRAMMTECRRSLDGGISVMMFPEGTRSQDGGLLPFRDGAFRLAIDAGVPVLPVALAGTRAMRPKHSKWFGEAHACAKVLSPIPSSGLGEQDVATLRERARDAIAGALPDLRSRYGMPAKP